MEEGYYVIRIKSRSPRGINHPVGVIVFSDKELDYEFARSGSWPSHINSDFRASVYDYCKDVEEKSEDLWKNNTNYGCFCGDILDNIPEDLKATGPFCIPPNFKDNSMYIITALLYDELVDKTD